MVWLYACSLTYTPLDRKALENQACLSTSHSSNYPCASARLPCLSSFSFVVSAAHILFLSSFFPLRKIYVHVYLFPHILVRKIITSSHLLITVDHAQYSLFVEHLSYVLEKRNILIPRTLVQTVRKGRL